MYTFAGITAMDLWGYKKTLPTKINLEGSGYLRCGLHLIYI